MITTDFKKFVLGFGGGLLLFWLLNRSFAKKEPAAAKKTPSEKDIQDALVAYDDARIANESPAVIADLNKLFAEQMGITISTRTDGKYVVTDTDGKELKVV